MNDSTNDHMRTSTHEHRSDRTRMAPRDAALGATAAGSSRPLGARAAAALCHGRALLVAHGALALELADPQATTIAPESTTTAEALATVQRAILSELGAGVSFAEP